MKLVLTVHLIIASITYVLTATATITRDLSTWERSKIMNEAPHPITSDDRMTGHTSKPDGALIHLLNLIIHRMMENFKM